MDDFPGEVMTPRAFLTHGTPPLREGRQVGRQGEGSTVAPRRYRSPLSSLHLDCRPLCLSFSLVSGVARAGFPPPGLATRNFYNYIYIPGVLKKKSRGCIRHK